MTMSLKVQLQQLQLWISQATLYPFHNNLMYNTKSTFCYFNCVCHRSISPPPPPLVADHGVCLIFLYSQL